MADQSLESTVHRMLTLAISLHQEERLDEAEDIYRRVLDIAPRHSGALHFFGVIQHQRGDSETAALLIRQAVKFDPDYHDARVNLGNVLKEQGLFGEAENEYLKVVEAHPNNATARNNLGVVLKAQKKFEAAATEFEQATILAPENRDAFQNLGNALKACGRQEEALTAYRRALEIDPSRCDSHLVLGRTLNAFGRMDEALSVYQKWLELEPDNPVAQHMLNACDGAIVPEKCSEGFIQQTFDSFADSFNEVLEHLNYHAPELVGRAVASLLSTHEELSVLDAGCGTGLCGKLLRDKASQLIGVDLSPKMLDQAKAAKFYDQLIVAELTQYMQEQTAAFDLIVSADTLIYFGALSPVFQAARKALRDDGAFIFTLEKEELGCDTTKFRLNPHGRYSHDEDHVKELLLEQGFRIDLFKVVVLRTEAGKPVDGLLIGARKSAEIDA
ncbi:MAG: hypothetical protein CL917_04150 [Deltaproteobacteria bacterium]|nr:hypothetical protein [Deltaproteobacteria bacterium]